MSQGQRQTADDVLELVYGHSKPGSGWQGYAGHWHLRLHSADPATHISSRGMRLWRTPQPGEHPGYFLVQHNVYETQLPVGVTTQRSQDGYWEAEYYRDRGNVAYVPSLHEHGDMPPWAARKMAVIDREAYVQLHNSVPMALLKPEDMPDKRLANTLAVPSIWATELFYGDGSHKWSCLGLWDLLTGALISVASIVERHVVVPDLGEKLDFDSFGVPQERPRLPEDPATWLAPGTSGTRKTLEVGSDGLFYTLPEAPCTWDPSSTSASGQKLVLLPDAQYLCLPEQAPGATGAPLQYEAGGKLRSVEGGLQRLCVRYDDQGRLATVVKERYELSR